MQSGSITMFIVVSFASLLVGVWIGEQGNMKKEYKIQQQKNRKSATRPGI